MPSHPYIVSPAPPGRNRQFFGSSYAVEEAASGRVLAKFCWREAAEQEKRRLNVEAGACPECCGEGYVLLRYAGPTPIIGRCETCDGSGLETEERGASDLQPAA